MGSEAQMTEWAKLAKRMGYPDAANVVAAADGMSQQRIFAEILIAFAAGRMAKPSSIPCFGNVLYDMQPISSDSGDVEEIIPPGTDDDEWLLSGKPEGTVVPPPSGRATAWAPNMKRQPIFRHARRN